VGKFGSLVQTQITSESLGYSTEFHVSVSLMKVVVLLSGGMDSVSALYHAEKEHEVVGV